MDSKQVNKLLSKMNLKGAYKQTDTFKNADLLIIINRNNPRENSFYMKEGFKEEELNNLPEEYSVIYLKHSNPHDSKQIVKSFMNFKYNKNTKG